MKPLDRAELSWLANAWMVTMAVTMGCASGASDPVGKGGASGGSTDELGGFGGAADTRDEAFARSGGDAVDGVLALPPVSSAQACTLHSQCATGFCVDGFCCDNACDNKCMACSVAKKGGGLDGVCGSVKYDTDPDNECHGGACDGKNVCKYYNSMSCTSAAQCLSNYCVDGVCCNNICMGACQACSTAKKGSGGDGVCGNIAGGADPDNECNPGECTGSGACNQVQTPAANGTLCTSASQCQSGYCADGVCCDSWCLTSCMACTAAKKGNGTNGTCGPIAYDTDPDGECWGGSCDGKGVCKQYNGVPCSASSQCLSAYCVDGFCCGNQCNGVCLACSSARKGSGYDGVCGFIGATRDPDNECPTGECNGAGVCTAAPLLANGSACSVAAACASANCVDGVCCDSACSGACKACTAAKKGQGTDGTCGAIKYDTDADDECYAGACDGAGACRYYNGAACSTSTNCLSNYCIDGVCCGNICNASCYACSAAKKGSGYDGACGLIANDTDPDNDCGLGVCNGGGSCKYPTCASNADCPSGASCTSSVCVCNLGYAGDGYVCTPGIQLEVGEASSCARLVNGTVKCWGGNAFGELGLGNTISRGDTPDEMGGNLPTVNLGVGKTATQVSVKGRFACALLNDGTVKCWGNNSAGQLGQGNTTNRGDNQGEMGDALPPINLGTGKTAVAIATGAEHACAILNNATVKCWGANASGQLGLGNTVRRGDNAGEMGDALPTVNLGTGKTATALRAGLYHTCARLNDGTLKCWGNNSQGQLGLGDALGRGDEPNEMGDALPAIDLGAGKTVASMALGSYHTCAILNDGATKCWGNNFYGQLGLGDTTARGDDPGEMGTNLPAVNVGAGKTSVGISVAGNHTCAILNDRSVKCWGNGADGRLGSGDTLARGDAAGEMGDSLPVVNLGTGKTATAISTNVHTCVVLNDGTVKCWGYNSNGQLGLGDTLTRGDGPAEMGNNLPTLSLF